jgi:hypothetical protein
MTPLRTRMAGLEQGNVGETLEIGRRAFARLRHPRVESVGHLAGVEQGRVPIRDTRGLGAPAVAVGELIRRVPTATFVLSTTTSAQTGATMLWSGSVTGKTQTARRRSAPESLASCASD